MIIFQVVRVLLVSGAAFLVALVAAPPLVSFLKKRSLTKKNLRSEKETPVFSALHKNKINTPTMGGVLIWGTVLLVALLFSFLSKVGDGVWSYFDFIDRAETYLPLFAMVVSGLVGLTDDLLGVYRIGPLGGGLKMKHKILVYTLIAAAGALWFYYRLDWDILAVPFFGNFSIGFWYIPFFMFVIIASAFSLNETDGLDGLAGGVSIFAFGALTVVAFVLGRYDLAVMGGAVLGSLLGFLWFNIYPARFFLGVTGSMSLGITMGVIAMLTNTAFLLPFFAVIPLVESLSVIIQVAAKKLFKRKIFLSSPVHHHFEAMGWPETLITMRFWIISAIASSLGLVLFFLARVF